MTDHHSENDSYCSKGIEEMTEYRMPELPAEPDGPVWDRNGNKCHQLSGEAVRDGTVRWQFEDGTTCTWESLLKYYGPLTGTPPLLKAWDEIDGKEAGHLPDGSIFAQERGIPFQAISKFRVGNGRNEWTRQAFQEIWKDASFTVLRVGWGRSAE